MNCFIAVKLDPASHTFHCAALEGIEEKNLLPEMSYFSSDCGDQIDCCIDDV